VGLKKKANPTKIFFFAPVLEAEGSENFASLVAKFSSLPSVGANAEALSFQAASPFGRAGDSSPVFS
jgi:hypothetical protein